MARTNDSFTRLQTAYKERLWEHVVKLREFIEKMNVGNLSAEEKQDLLQISHSLSGSGGTYGFPDISQAGENINVLLRDSDDLVDCSLEQLVKATKILLGTCEKYAISADFRGQNFILDTAQVYHDENVQILVVDDDNEITDFLELHLEHRRMSVRSAHDGQEALALLKGWTPDLIILDIVMPRMNGHEFLRVMKEESPLLQTVPIIMLTAEKHQKDINAAFDSGIIDYVTKPFKAEHFLVKVEEVLFAVKKKILVIENDEETLELLQYTYRDKGFQVLTAGNGIEGWTKMREHVPDLVVLDWMLPKMDALGILKNMKNDPKLCEIPVIVLANKDEEHEIIPHPYALSKPYIPRDLIKRSMAVIKS
ncbi:MAG: response regulator [Alphaproteobacteria bacterium]|jgi:DNA-binding response OmpR family regulator|nr:response regulator [Alphaproteobacteria bacterium]MDP7223423.1 response regulator [Alphaproteobacteria bacterium]